MADIGRITNTSIDTNADGDVSRVMLQVELIDDNEDVRTVELFIQAGEDSNPANNSRAVVIDVTDRYQICIGVSDDLTPTCAQGEREIYSTDNPVTQKKASIKWDKDGNVIINQGSNHSVQYEALLSAFNQLKSDLNNFVTAYNLHEHNYISPTGAAVTTGNTGPGTASTADMSSSKINTVKVP